MPARFFVYIMKRKTIGSEQKRPGANRPPEFVPESPSKKGSLGVIFSPRNYRENAHSKSANFEGRHWGPLARPAPFVYFRNNRKKRKTEQNGKKERNTKTGDNAKTIKSTAVWDLIPDHPEGKQKQPLCRRREEHSKRNENILPVVTQHSRT